MPKAKINTLTHTQVIKYTKTIVEAHRNFWREFRKASSSSNKGQGHFKLYLAMERTRHAAYQQRYRKKVNEINRTNSEFMTHAENKAPWLVAEFFADKAVMLTFFTCFLTIQNHDFFPFQTPYRSNKSSSSNSSSSSMQKHCPK